MQGMHADASAWMNIIIKVDVEILQTVTTILSKSTLGHRMGLMLTSLCASGYIVDMLLDQWSLRAGNSQVCRRLQVGLL